jgi:hypothetical protein
LVRGKCRTVYRRKSKTPEKKDYLVVWVPGIKIQKLNFLQLGKHPFKAFSFLVLITQSLSSFKVKPFLDFATVLCFRNTVGWTNSRNRVTHNVIYHCLYNVGLSAILMFGWYL